MQEILECHLCLFYMQLQRLIFLNFSLVFLNIHSFNYSVYNICWHRIVDFWASSTNLTGFPICLVLNDKYFGSIGMQWPPTPGPGLKDSNPNGFVFAARQLPRYQFLTYCIGLRAR